MPDGRCKGEKIVLTKKQVDRLKNSLDSPDTSILSDLIETIKEMEKTIRGCDQEMRDICKTMGHNYDSPCVTSAAKGFLSKYEGKEKR
jgi:hypothetical protein